MSRDNTGQDMQNTLTFKNGKPVKGTKTIGERSIEAQLLIELAKTIEVDDILTYEAIAQCIGFCIKATNKRSTWYTAERVLLVEHGMHFHNIPTMGYKRVSDSTEVNDSTSRSRIKNVARRRKLSLVNVDFASLSDGDKRRHTAEMSIAHMTEMVVMNQSIKQLESKIDASDTMQKLSTKQTLESLGWK